MKAIAIGIVLLACAGVAEAQCNKEVRKPQKTRDLVRLKWRVAGRTWDAVLTWQTMSVSDNGDEETRAGIGVFDNREHRTIGDSRSYYLTPNRCDKRIEPSLFPAKLMGRDFLLVTLPTSQWGQGGSGTVMADMYSIDEKGRLTKVFHSAYRGTFTRGPTCRHLLRSYIKPVNADGSRIAWVYEAPGIEWARTKAECAKTKIDRVEQTWIWKNGCFTVEDPENNDDRLTTDWDEEMCVPGVGRVDKKARPDGGTPPDGGAQPASPSP